MSQPNSPHPGLPQPQSGPVQQPYPSSGPIPQYPGSGPVPPPQSSSGPAPQPYPGQQPTHPATAPPAGAGRLVLDSSYDPLAFTMGLLKPGITINGRPGPVARWGRTVVDVPPGQYQVELHVNYLWRFGSATAVVPVHAGGQVDVFYRAPMVTFGAGAIGPGPQATPNRRLIVGLLIGWFVFCLLVAILPLLLL
ncbi:hypothetical protein ABZ805_14585 [Saccharopolyspora sp. NPDC047091]|uniref:hypothetical protein n=1 Tax=Saccharopolyspora sp. NPDC047091 TaxID=3155924 RepID=UPI0033E29A79